jgi:hypothetical protein
MLERLKGVEKEGAPEGFAHLVLRYGIEFHQWNADWCERTARALQIEASGERRTA